MFKIFLTSVLGISLGMLAIATEQSTDAQSRPKASKAPTVKNLQEYQWVHYGGPWWIKGTLGEKGEYKTDGFWYWKDPTGAQSGYIKWGKLSDTVTDIELLKQEMIRKMDEPWNTWKSKAIQYSKVEPYNNLEMAALTGEVRVWGDSERNVKRFTIRTLPTEKDASKEYHLLFTDKESESNLKEFAPWTVLYRQGEKTTEETKSTDARVVAIEADGLMAIGSQLNYFVIHRFRVVFPSKTQ